MVNTRGTPKMNMIQHASRTRLARGIAVFILFAAGWTARAEGRTATFSSTRALAANESFEIQIAGEGTRPIAVTVGKLDVSSLFERSAPDKLRYHGRGPALPAGPQTVTVFEVDDDGGWTQIGQFPVSFLSRLGFVSTKFEPSAEITGKGQFGAKTFPEEPTSDRDQFQDATTQLGMRTELVRPAFTVRGEAQMSGVTLQNEALRFGSEGERAPRLDLSGYRLDLQRGPVLLSVGHLNIGGSRHLISGFSSRGAAVTVGEGRTLSLQLAAMNGSNIVGWENALGLDNDQHRVYSATVGVETRPLKPGLLRLEYGYFLGSSQPISNFNQGAVVSAEKSRGNTFRVLSASPNGRFRFDGGYTISRFAAAFDPQLEEGLDVTPIRSERKDAHYADLTLGLLQARKIARTTATVGLTLRHERIQPQFRSLGTSVQADLQTDAGDVNFTLGPLSGTVGHMRTRDNLAGIASILTTHLDRSSANLTLSAPSLFGKNGVDARWAPMLTLQAESIHQFGSVLISEDFPIESIPDEVGWNAILGAEWQAGQWRIGTKVGRTNRDSQQVGSEQRDSVTDTTLLTLGWTASKPFSINGEVGFDSNENLEQSKTENALRWGANMTWTFFRDIAMAGSISNNRAWDSLDERDSDTIDSSLELSGGFKLSRADRRKGRLFVRWTNRRGDTFERAFGVRDIRRNQAFATGLTFSLF
jgi:hypothetical protein